MQFLWQQIWDKFWLVRLWRKWYKIYTKTVVQNYNSFTFVEFAASHILYTWVKIYVLTNSKYSPKYFPKHSQKYSNIFQRLSWWHARDKSMVGSKTNKSRSCSKPPDLISASQPLVTWGQTNIFCKKSMELIKNYLGELFGENVTLGRGQDPLLLFQSHP